jgi:hypothetical protein
MTNRILDELQQAFIQEYPTISVVIQMLLHPLNSSVVVLSEQGTSILYQIDLA